MPKKQNMKNQSYHQLCWWELSLVRFQNIYQDHFVEPVFHYETLTFQLEVIKVDKMKDVITISVEAVNEQENRVLDAVVMVQPPQVTIDELTEKEGTLTYE